MNGLGQGKYGTINASAAPAGPEREALRQAIRRKLQELERSGTPMPELRRLAASGTLIPYQRSTPSPAGGAAPGMIQIDESGFSLPELGGVNVWDTVQANWHWLAVGFGAILLLRMMGSKRR